MVKKKRRTATSSIQAIFLRSVKYTKVVSTNTHRLYDKHTFAVFVLLTCVWETNFSGAVEVIPVRIRENAAGSFIIKLFVPKDTHPEETW